MLAGALLLTGCGNEVYAAAKDAPRIEQTKYRKEKDNADRYIAQNCGGIPGLSAMPEAVPRGESLSADIFRLGIVVRRKCSKLCAELTKGDC